MEIKRIEPQQAREKVKNNSALLVCAYPDENKCRSYHLEEAIFLDDLHSRLSSLDNSQEIILYCN